MGATNADSVFAREILEDVSKRRSLFLKFLLPIILILPFVLVKMPSAVQGSGLPLIALFLGVLGSAVGIARLRDTKLLERLAILPLSPRRVMLESLAANALMDTLQLLIPTWIVVATIGWNGSGAVIIVFLLLCTVVVSNALGMVVAGLAGGSGEVHLFSSLAVLAVAGGSGLFMQMSDGALAAMTLSPASLLSRAISTGIDNLGPSLVATITTTVLSVIAVVALARRTVRG